MAGGDILVGLGTGRDLSADPLEGILDGLFEKKPAATRPAPSRSPVRNGPQQPLKADDGRPAAVDEVPQTQPQQPQQPQQFQAPQQPQPLLPQRQQQEQQTQQHQQQPPQQQQHQLQQHSQQLLSQQQQPPPFQSKAISVQPLRTPLAGVAGGCGAGTSISCRSRSLEATRVQQYFPPPSFNLQPDMGASSQGAFCAAAQSPVRQFRSSCLTSPLVSTRPSTSRPAAPSPPRQAVVVKMSEQRVLQRQPSYPILAPVARRVQPCTNAGLGSLTWTGAQKAAALSQQTIARAMSLGNVARPTAAHAQGAHLNLLPERMVCRGPTIPIEQPTPELTARTSRCCGQSGFLSTSSRRQASPEESPVSFLATPNGNRSLSTQPLRVALAVQSDATATDGALPLPAGYSVHAANAAHGAPPLAIIVARSGSTASLGRITETRVSLPGGLASPDRRQGPPHRMFSHGSVSDEHLSPPYSARVLRLSADANKKPGFTWQPCEHLQEESVKVADSLTESGASEGPTVPQTPVVPAAFHAEAFPSAQVNARGRQTSCLQDRPVGESNAHVAGYADDARIAQPMPLPPVESDGGRTMRGSSDTT
mmetsp:Transcript_70486/g.196160  ORF Transcript_70486/g.196160 Transcript_70486/m.196160 type:complete len:593 (-) Transcript_70486:38-1816(-)